MSPPTKVRTLSVRGRTLTGGKDALGEHGEVSKFANAWSPYRVPQTRLKLNHACTLLVTCNS